MIAAPVTCSLCGTTMPGRTGGLRPDAAQVVLDEHQATATCWAGAARLDAYARGLASMLEFEVLGVLTLINPDDQAADRATALRAAGVQVDDLRTRLVHTASASFDIAAEPWAPSWAVAVAFVVTSPVGRRAALRRFVADPALQAALLACTRIARSDFDGWRTLATLIVQEAT